LARLGAPLFGAPTFMSAWVYLLAAKEFIREGCEWTRSIARRRDWSADINVGMGLVTHR